MMVDIVNGQDMSRKRGLEIQACRRWQWPFSATVLSLPAFVVAMQLSMATNASRDALLHACHLEVPGEWVEFACVARVRPPPCWM